ncbi:MAG: DUF4397 domain-containing protein [Polyangiaceae bacterium]|nr:DUF4397 domain-containing protein [Polyangiaceae bacterium]
MRAILYVLGCAACLTACGDSSTTTSTASKEASRSGATSAAPKKSAAPAASPAPSPSAAPPAAASSSAAVAEGPPAKVRLVNVYLEGGKGQAVDIWSKPFKGEAKALAKDVGFGKASDWFDLPEGVGRGGADYVQVKIVPAGSGAGGKEIHSIGRLEPGSKVTEILATSDSGQGTMQPNAEVGKDAPKAPAAGKGLVVANAMQLIPYEKDLTETYGGRSFHLSQSGAECLNKTVLGGTNRWSEALAPGKTKLRFHKWPGDCKSAPVFEIDVDVAADKGTLVVLYTADGKKIESLQVPMELK